MLSYNIAEQKEKRLRKGNPCSCMGGGGAFHYILVNQMLSNNNDYSTKTYVWLDLNKMRRKFVLLYSSSNHAFLYSFFISPNRCRWHIQLTLD